MAATATAVLERPEGPGEEKDEPEAGTAAENKVIAEESDVHVDDEGHGHPKA